jgi:hypothetical protein
MPKRQKQISIEGVGHRPRCSQTDEKEKEKRTKENKYAQNAACLSTIKSFFFLLLFLGPDAEIRVVENLTTTANGM